MGFVLILIFAAIAAMALAFVIWPLWRSKVVGRSLLVASLAAFVLAIAGGTYVLVGHPEMALRTIETPSELNVPALVSKLAWRMRQSPQDPRGWLILGRTYLAMDDAKDSVIAFHRAIATATPPDRLLMLPSYGVALMAYGIQLKGDTEDLTPEAEEQFHEAEAVFREFLAHNPKDVMGRFSLGQAYAEERDTRNALAVWNNLLADTPANAPWRGTLVDRIALLEGRAVQAPPNVQAMVQGLADRLKAHPDDPQGWLKLVKAYAVLGETAKAHEAVAVARKTLKGNDLVDLEAEARALHLEN